MKVLLIISFFALFLISNLFAQSFTRITSGDIVSSYSLSNGWGDYDNDGDLDVLLADGGNFRIYVNNRGNIFTEQKDISFSTASNIKISQSDLDNDGDLDILLFGEDSYTTEKVLNIYRNDGLDSLGFTDIGTDIRKVAGGSADWGDYNNDGYPDLLIAGGSGNKVAKVFRNNTDGSFSEQTGISLEGVVWCFVAWGDYDNDGDLDILLTGEDNINLPVSKIYTNNTNYPNQKPSPPNNLQSMVAGYDMKLTWDNAVDPDCPEGSLYYNMRIGSTPGAIDIMAPMSDLTSGYRNIPAIGNAHCNTFGIIKNLIPGNTYYWSVQAIDQSFTGGEWAEEQSFVVSVVNADFEFETVCFGSETSFTDMSYTSGDPIAEWKWDFGDGNTSSLPNPGHIYLRADTFSVQLIVISSQESDTITEQIIVRSKPFANFIVEPVCHGQASKFINLSDTSGLNITSWNWEFGDSQISDQKSPAPHYYAQAGEYIAKLSVASDNGCSDTISKSVIVARYPVVIVSANGPVEFCEGEDVLLCVSENINYKYQWKLDEVPLSDSVNYHCKAIYKGAYSVDVENTLAGCLSNSLAVNVKVESVPISPLINYTGDTTFCQGDSLVLSVPFNVDYTYHWKQNGFVTGILTNNYVVKISGNYSLDVSNSSGCIAESYNSVNVTVNEIPSKPVINSTGYDISDCPQGKLITLMVDQAKDQYNYQWKRDGVLIDNETESMIQDYLKEGDYSIIVDNFGCSSESDVFRLYHDPESPEKPEIIAEGSVIWYLACSNDSATTYSWHFEGIQVAGANGCLYVAGQQLGKYEVIISNQGGCFAKSDPLWIPLGTGMDENPFQNLKIYPNPTPGVFTIEMDNPIFGELITRIFSQNAAEIFNIKFDKTTRHFKAQVDLSGQGQGMYIITFVLEDYRTERKLIVE
ncbi:MAG: VCBS repeat-containing protein [Bacteroidales bacterium]|nr:VCBS repeat-containing protein [Bacteroidales bacterium]